MEQKRLLQIFVIAALISFFSFQNLYPHCNHFNSKPIENSFFMKFMKTLQLTDTNKAIKCPTIILDSIVWDDTCGNAIGMIYVEPSTGQAPFSFKWNSIQPDTSSTDTSFTAIKLPADTYNLITTDANGCADTAYISVENFIPQMIDSVYTKRDTCGAGTGIAGVILDSITGPPYYYEWDTEPPVFATEISNVSPGFYIFQVTDQYGCVAIDTIEVKDTLIQLTSETYIINEDTCAYGVGRAYVSDLFNAVEPIAIEWFDAQNNLISDDSIAVNLQTDETYSVIISDKYGCLDTNSIQMQNFIPELIQEVLVTNDICASDNGTATVVMDNLTHGYNFIWNTDPVQDSIVATNLDAGEYSVSVTDFYGCFASESIIIQEDFYELQPTIIMESDTCEAGVGNLIVDSVFLGQAPFEFVWFSQQDTILPVSLRRNASGLYADTTYIVHVYDKNRCKGIASGTVDNYINEFSLYTTTKEDNCTAGIGSATVFAEGSYGPFSFVWENDSTKNDSLLDNLREGVYTVVVKDKFNCPAVTTAHVGSICETFIPNIITPNDDGYNDYLEIQNIEFFPDSYLVIYNRWGKIVYEQNNYLNEMKWSGTNKSGRDLPVGTYFYSLQLGPKNESFHGQINIIR